MLVNNDQEEHDKKADTKDDHSVTQRPRYWIPSWTVIHDVRSQIRDAIIAGLALSLAVLSSASSDSVDKRKRDNKEESSAQAPILISELNHHIKDNAHNIIDWTALNLQAYRGTQSEVWKHQSQVCWPIKVDLLDSHLMTFSVNPKVIAKMHDRGADLNMRLFLEANANIDHWPGKIWLMDNNTAVLFSKIMLSPKEFTKPLMHCSILVMHQKVYNLKIIVAILIWKHCLKWDSFLELVDEIPKFNKKLSVI